MYAFPQCSVVDAVSEREVLKTSSVFLQPIEYKLMKHLGSPERCVGLHHVAHVLQLRSPVVKQESRVESATARKENNQDDDWGEKKKKSETRLTASVLKQDPNT